MLIHEFEHVKQGHSIDILVLEVLTVFQWFNPFFWLLKRLLRENHEYLADRAVLVHFSNPGYYKKLLLQQFVGPQIDLANNFNYSLIKKRIQMMSQIKSSKLARIKLFGGIFLASTLIVIFACEQEQSTTSLSGATDQTATVEYAGASLTIGGDSVAVEKLKELIAASGDLELAKNDDSEEKGVTVVGYGKSAEADEEVKTIDGKPIFFIVEKMPEFPGGELELRKTIARAIKYPVKAQEEGIQGKVYVSFVVDSNGKVRHARVVRGVSASLNKEAIRVISSLPDWNPGKQRGEAVNVSYTVPINFLLE
jgi:TonB family protein